MCLSLLYLVSWPACVASVQWFECFTRHNYFKQLVQMIHSFESSVSPITISNKSISWRVKLTSTYSSFLLWMSRTAVEFPDNISVCEKFIRIFRGETVSATQCWKKHKIPHQTEALWLAGAVIDGTYQHEDGEVKTGEARIQQDELLQRPGWRIHRIKESSTFSMYHVRVKIQRNIQVLL